MPCVAPLTSSNRGGTDRASQVPNILSTRIPRSKVDPGGPSRTSPNRSVCVGFWHVNTMAIRFKRDNGAVSSFGKCGLPYGLRVSLCTLQLTCSAFTSAVAVATLGTSGWLGLTRQGLSPCKKMPSLAWRTNVAVKPRPIAGHHSSDRTCLSRSRGRFEPSTAGRRLQPPVRCQAQSDPSALPAGRSESALAPRIERLRIEVSVRSHGLLRPPHLRRLRAKGMRDGNA